MAIRPTLPVLAIAVLVGAAPPVRASDVSFAWIRTDTALPPLDGVPQLAPGDTAVLEIRVQADSEGVAAVSIWVEYDPRLLRVLDWERCPPAPGNEFGGMDVCGTLAAGLVPGHAVFLPVVENEIGRSGPFAVEVAPPGGCFLWTFELAHVVFQVVPNAGDLPAATEVVHYYEPGISGVGDSTGTFSFPDVTPAPLLIVPAPSAVPAAPAAGIRWLGLALAVVGAALARRAASRA